jgi:hypothetical protein
MCLRARKARPSVVGVQSATNELVRAMTYRMYGAFIASLSAVTLLLAANETLARSGAAPRGGFTSRHSILHPSVAHALRHHRRIGTPWLATGDAFYGPSNGEPMADGSQPTSGDVHYTYTNDVPWDWAHRYPPNVAPSERQYVPSCPTETVTVPGHGGEEQTVTIMRCY